MIMRILQAPRPEKCYSNIKKRKKNEGIVAPTYSNLKWMFQYRRLFAVLSVQIIGTILLRKRVLVIEFDKVF